MKSMTFRHARPRCSVFCTAAAALIACSSEPNSAPKNLDRVGHAPSESISGASRALLVDASDPKNAYLHAVASLSSGCTGAFIKTRDNEDAPAYLLTAGRCLEDPGLSFFDVFVDVQERTKGSLIASFDLSRDENDQARTATYVRTAYATLKGTDLGLVELGRTVGDLQKLGIDPLPIADTAPMAGARIEMVGVPSGQSGVHRDVRRARCTEGERRANVVELNQYFFDLHVNDCAGLGDGSTGGPVLDEQGRLYGVFNTHFADAEPRQPCYLNYPCEVGTGPERGVDGANYVVDVTALSACFDAGGRLDLNAAGCKLDSGLRARGGNRLWRIVSPTFGDPPLPSTWNTEFYSSLATDTHYRYKVGLLQSLDCRSAQGYSEPLALGDSTLANLAVPSEAGSYGLCLLTGPRDLGDVTWQSFAQPTVFIKKILRPTTVDPEATAVTAEQAFALGQQVLDNYRDIATSHGARLMLGFGPLATSNFTPFIDRTWVVQLGLDFRRAGITADGVTFSICHETGHGLGGFPFGSRTAPGMSQGLASGQYGTVTASEGQADYFAAKDCLPRLWGGQQAVNAEFRSTVSDYVRASCDAVWATADEQNLCYRIAAVADGFGRWLSPNGNLSVETPNTTPLPATNDGGDPENQCRVDTVFQGALCSTKFRDPFVIPGLIEPFDQIWKQGAAVEAAAAPDSCTEGVGARPSCWFIPIRRPSPIAWGSPKRGCAAWSRGERCS